MKIYHSNLSEYKEYKSIAGVKSAWKRFMSVNSDCKNLITVLMRDKTFMKHFLYQNPWFDQSRDDYRGDVCAVRPYKDGWMIVRHFAVKPDYSEISNR